MRLFILLIACSTSTSSFYSIDPEAIRRACAMEVSCFTNPPLSPAGSCVSQFEAGLADGTGIFFGPSAMDISRYVGCANSANNCTDALNCASRNHGTDWCNAHPNGGCDGDSLIFCDGGWGLQIRDCSSLGLRCASANGVSVCTDGNTCDPATATHCSGGLLVECDGTAKLESHFDCGSFRAGATCKSDSMGGGGCVPAASAGCATDSVTCQGATAVVCSSGGQAEVPCGRFASHCVLDGQGGFQCVGDGTSCTSTSPDSCSADSLQICVNGTWQLTACSSIGLTTCQTVNGAARCQ